MCQKKIIEKAMAIHDLSGLGRVALMVVIPILSTLGIQVIPLPTAVLSASTNYNGYKYFDLTKEMQEIITHWSEEKIEFDCIYSGFLGSSSQIQIVINLLQKFSRPHQLIVVDPVFGDNGKLYASMDKKIVNEMKKLIQYADVITPNTTETCQLLDVEYTATLPLKTIKNYAYQLAQKGPETVIITGVNDCLREDLTAVVAYQKKTNQYWKVSCTYIPEHYPGTGDIFTSVVTSCLLKGDSLPLALDRAVHFTSICIRATSGSEVRPHEGVLLEKVLDSLKTPLNLLTSESI